MSELFNPEERMSKEQLDKRNKERDERTGRILNDFKQITDLKLRREFVETLSQHDIMIMKDLVSIALIIKLKTMKVECRESEDLDILLQVIYNCYVNKCVTDPEIIEESKGGSSSDVSNTIFNNNMESDTDDELPNPFEPDSE